MSADRPDDPRDAGLDPGEPTWLPQHRLVAYQVAKELLIAVRDAKISDAHLRDQALRAAKNTCLNVAEGVGRVARGEKARAYTIARGEASEAAAAVEIAAIAGDASPAAARDVRRLAGRLVALLTGLIRSPIRTT